MLAQSGADFSQPPELSPASDLIRHILWVLYIIRRANPDSSGDLRDARRGAISAIAAMEGLWTTTILDACQRRLGLASIRDFDRPALAWLKSGDSKLRKLLEEKAPETKRETDLVVIKHFFSGSGPRPSSPREAPEPQQVEQRVRTTVEQLVTSLTREKESLATALSEAANSGRIPLAERMLRIIDGLQNLLVQAEELRGAS